MLRNKVALESVYFSSPSELAALSKRAESDKVRETEIRVAQYKERVRSVTRASRALSTKVQEPQEEEPERKASAEIGIARALEALGVNHKFITQQHNKPLSEGLRFK